jgi:septal ring factor EnvC (AmiA/AmiB activator)
VLLVALFIPADLTSSLPVIFAAFVTVAGSGGVVFGALRYNRDEAGKIVIQQTSVLTDMRGLNDELQEALNRTRTERDELLSEVRGCREEIARLRGQVTALQDALAELSWPGAPRE